MTGFEPATSSSRTKRATGLRYIPSYSWSRTRDLNPRPADYESAALPLSYTGMKLMMCECYQRIISETSIRF